MPISLVNRSPHAWRLARRAGVAIVAVLALAATGCNRSRSSGDTAAAAGDAGAIEVDALNYDVTPDRYRRWVAAQRALDALPGLPEPPRLDPARFGDDDVARAVRYLEADARARAALARAGISARDYVLTTLALDQALVASTSTSAAPSGGRSAASPRPGTAPSTSRSAEGSTRGRTTSSGAASAAPGQSTRPATARTRTRYRNLPPQNSELVERNRDDITRVRQGMRFHIVNERVDTLEAEGALAAPSTDNASNRTIPAGTTVSLRSDSRVCTNTHKAGDRVTGTVTAPVAGMNGAEIPVGATASLSVVGPRGAKAAAGPMEFALNSITIDGRTYPATGTAVASRVDRVRASAGSKDAQKVVGGAAIGAAAGQVLGKDTKSTVIGAAVGAAAGAAAAQATARYEGCVPLGAPIQATTGDALRLRI